MGLVTRAIVVDAVRTPFGRNGGGLSGIRADDLAAAPIRHLRSRTGDQVDEVILGATNQAGEDNRNVARMAALLAGLPVSTPAVTVNRLCGSGSEALVHAARLVRAGEVDLGIAGGVESMSRAPFVLERASCALDPHPRMHRTTVGWRMTNPAFPATWTASLGACAEASAQRRGVSRAEMDDWAARSHALAASSWESGHHGSWVEPIAGVDRDDCLRPETTIAQLAALPSAFTDGGEVTAGNSSPISDGAVAAVIASEFRAAELGEPLGEIIGSVTVGVEPDDFAAAPAAAIQVLLERHGLTLNECALLEIQEAFAAVVAVSLRELPPIPEAKVNPFGGAVALGHPLGASAARLVIDTIRGLRARGGGYGVAAICIGVGQGQAVLCRVR
jgi:acetyl-CoA acyltransferase